VILSSMIRFFMSTETKWYFRYKKLEQKMTDEGLSEEEVQIQNFTVVNQQLEGRTKFSERAAETKTCRERDGVSTPQTNAIEYQRFRTAQSHWTWRFWRSSNFLGLLSLKNCKNYPIYRFRCVSYKKLTRVSCTP